jgi:putative endonuclease
MYYVYIILCHNGSYYTGSTNNVTKRFNDHLKGRGARYTKSHKPVKIVYEEEFPNKSLALRREAKIKKWPRRKKLTLIGKAWTL